MRTEGGKRYSLCQNSYDCTFKAVRVPDRLFGLIILDIDLQRDDLVDFVLFSSGDAPASELDHFENEVRRSVDQLAPAFSDGERQRRKKKAIVMRLEQCVGEQMACRLNQSEIRGVSSR
jgi:hypothetical protein